MIFEVCPSLEKDLFTLRLDKRFSPFSSTIFIGLFCSQLFKTRGIYLHGTRQGVSLFFFFFCFCFQMNDCYFLNCESLSTSSLPISFQTFSGSKFCHIIHGKLAPCYSVVTLICLISFPSLVQKWVCCPILTKTM